MAEVTKITVEDAMRAAFAALLRGDLEERDRLITLVKDQMHGRSMIPADEPLEGDHAGQGRDREVS